MLKDVSIDYFLYSYSFILGNVRFHFLYTISYPCNLSNILSVTHVDLKTTRRTGRTKSLSVFLDFRSAALQTHYSISGGIEPVDLRRQRGTRYGGRRRWPYLLFWLLKGRSKRTQFLPASHRAFRDAIASNYQILRDRAFSSHLHGFSKEFG